MSTLWTTRVWSCCWKDCVWRTKARCRRQRTVSDRFTAGQCFCVTGFAFTNACSVSGWCLRCFVSLTVKRSWSLIITWFPTLCWRWVSCTSTRGGKSKPSIYCRKPSEFSLGQNTSVTLCKLQTAFLSWNVLLISPVRKNYKEYSMESRTQFRVHAALTKLKADTNDQDEITTLWGKMIPSQWRLFCEDQNRVTWSLYGENERPKTRCGFYAVVLPSVNLSVFWAVIWETLKTSSVPGG